MIVYVLLSHRGYGEDSMIEHVASTREKALEWLERGEYYNPYVRLHAVDVDGNCNPHDDGELVRTK